MRRVVLTRPSTPIQSSSTQRLPDAFLRHTNPAKPIPKHTLAFACQRGLSTREMAAEFKCSQPHVVRQLAQHSLKTNAAIKRAGRPS